ncbi:hypothetical protein HOD29_05365 [archaeon]|jgi:hypothetical protein|nr:hypothetical protein [archaeon]
MADEDHEEFVLDKSKVKKQLEFETEQKKVVEELETKGPSKKDFVWRWVIILFVALGLALFSWLFLF